MRSKIKRYHCTKQPKPRALSGMFDVVRPGSKYPASYAGMPEDMDDWNCGHWKSYYLANKKAMGQQAAVQLVETDMQRIGTWATSQLCNYDCAWVNFFKKEGIDTSSLVSKIYCAADNLAEATGSVTQAVGGVADFAATVTNNKVLFVGLGLGGLYLFNRLKG